MNDTELNNLLSDKDVANIIKLSPSWIRKQRYLRKNNQEHVFAVDPVLVGESPRYRQTDVFLWLQQL